MKIRQLTTDWIFILLDFFLLIDNLNLFFGITFNQIKNNF